jgi:hypothetical protein
MVPGEVMPGTLGRRIGDLLRGEFDNAIMVSLLYEVEDGDDDEWDVVDDDDDDDGAGVMASELRFVPPTFDDERFGDGAEEADDEVDLELECDDEDAGAEEDDDDDDDDDVDDDEGNGIAYS